ncbi:related to hexose transporter protein [Rhynchosporium graminicola]|uniref:Related to hexose transporter protein n=1 Tax=Rhynchosporium graminicola TaxID=2792576 RepID=A0A1E1L5E6_9HELO|nr:related to hexose transporter protein [Rhynchosporium commune]
MPFYTPSKATFEVGGREFPRITWYKEKDLRGLYVLLMLAVLTSATNGKFTLCPLSRRDGETCYAGTPTNGWQIGYDGSMMNGLQALTPWKESFNYPSTATRGLLNAIMSVGSILALPITPYIADILGRRAGVMTGCIIMIIGVVLQSIGSNIAMFIAARFLIGFGVAIAHGAAPLLITELVHPQHRAIFTTIYNSTWYLGSIIAAWLTFGTEKITTAWSWRIPSIVQAAPSIIQLIAIWMVPESPRYLISRGHNEKALHVLAKAHAHGNVDDELVQIEYLEIRETIALEKEIEGNGWMQLIKTKGNRHRLIILISLGFFSQWSGNGLVSYYISDVLEGIGITDPKEKLEINGVLQIVNFAVALFMCFMIDKFGRRPLFLLATGGMLGSFVVWTICAAQYAQTKVKAAATAEIAFIFIYYGLTIMFLAVDLSLFFNSYVNPVALGKLKWKYYIVYDIWLAFELAIVYFFYIETQNTALEEIVKYFDGEDALLGGTVATDKARALLVENGLDNKVPVVSSSEHRETSDEEKRAL